MAWHRIRPGRTSARQIGSKMSPMPLTTPFLWQNWFWVLGEMARILTTEIAPRYCRHLFGAVWALDGSNSNSQTRHVSNSTTNSWSEFVPLNWNSTSRKKPLRKVWWWQERPEGTLLSLCSSITSALHLPSFLSRPPLLSLAEMLYHLCAFVVGPRDRQWPMTEGHLTWEPKTCWLPETDDQRPTVFCAITSQI